MDELCTRLLTKRSDLLKQMHRWSIHLCGGRIRVFSNGVKFFATESK